VGPVERGRRLAHHARMLRPGPRVADVAGLAVLIPQRRHPVDEVRRIALLVKDEVWALEGAIMHARAVFVVHPRVVRRRVAGGPVYAIKGVAMAGDENGFGLVGVWRPTVAVVVHVR